MSDGRRRTGEPARKPHGKQGEESKGQYGGPKGLEPGGGRDIEEAMEPKDVDPETTETGRK
jgi:hypothetical protein